jgi:hypothetical protein
MVSSRRLSLGGFWQNAAGYETVWSVGSIRPILAHGTVKFIVNT